MAELGPVARPYAQAVFELAREAGQLPAWSAVLQCAALAASSAEFRALLNVPGSNLERLAGLLAGVCEDALGKEGPLAGGGDAPAHNFLRLLAENRRLAALPAIAEAFEALRAQAENTVDVRVRSASELSQAQQQRLAEALKKRYGKEVRITVELDPQLLGGARIQVGDQVIDGSVRTRLEKLANAMTAG